MATQARAPSQTKIVAPPAAPVSPAAELLAGINEVARELVPYEVSGSTLDQVVEGVGRLLQPDGTAILVRERHGDYVFERADGVLSEWSRFVLSGHGTELLEELLRGDAVVLFHRKQRTGWAREFLFAAGMSWGAIAPIRAHGRNIGALLINHGSIPEFGDGHVAALQTLATLAGVAIREDERRAQTEELFMGVIVSLTMAIEAKDPYTEGHSVRVAAYSEAIGKQLGLPPATLDLVHRTCLIHDIGKIAVDETILGKRDPLSSSEREKMDLHPQIGESILRPIALLRPLLPGVRSHHERFDGTGYPDGLAGGAIPIEARIMAVADAFDAMTSNRPYRQALPEEDALAELRRNAGTHFDPRVVAAFEQIYPAVKRTLEHLRPKAQTVSGREPGGSSGA
jgi:HD-GYP domain-containing protein (c-di-GMP phosphodiesterase class II)